jgi:hypothetical protein
VGFLPLYPAPTDHTVVDPVVHGLSALHIFGLCRESVERFG